MAGNIKGITIELNGDTTKLDRALRSVNRETQTLQRQLIVKATVADSTSSAYSNWYGESPYLPTLTATPVVGGN